MRAHVVMPPELVEEVDEIVGKRERSEFLTEAVADKLRRQQPLAAAEAAMGSLKDIDIPGWETPESTSEWVRALRREADERIAQAWDPDR